MNGLFTENEYYVEYETYLRHLNELMAKGLGDTEEAEDVRDRMDTPWYHLTEDEVKRLRGLSADLYMLQDDEVFQPSDGRTKIQIGQAVFAAVDQERWTEALSLMRQPNSLPREKVAVWRVAAYESLGDLEAALLFLRYAIKLDPGHPVLKAVELPLLYRCDRKDEACQKAETYLNDTSVSAFLRINAAGFLAQIFDHTENVRFRSIVPALKDALRAEVLTSLRRDNRVFGYEILGYCYFRLGEIQKAYDAVTEGVRLSSSETLIFMQSNLKQILAGGADASVKYEQLMTRELQTLRPSLSADTYALAAA